MNKQEILDEINKTKEHLANLEQRLKECEYEKWEPEEGEKYYFIDHSNKVYETEYRNKYTYCKDMYDAYNCFQTKEEAEQEAEKILVRRMLENIARRLNKGEKIDWNNLDQSKSFLCLDCKTQSIERDCNVRNKIQGVVYCLDTNFRKIAIQEIGEERLKKYLRGE